EDVDIVLINFACLINKSIKKKNNEIFGFIEPNNYAKADINLDAVSYILPLYGSTCVSVFPPQEPTGRTQTVNKISLPFNTTMKILNTQWINSLVEAPGNVTDMVTGFFINEFQDFVVVSYTQTGTFNDPVQSGNLNYLLSRFINMYPNKPFLVFVDSKMSFLAVKNILY